MSLRKLINELTVPAAKRAEQSAWLYTGYKVIASRFGQDNLFSLVDFRMPSGLGNLINTIGLNHGMVDGIASEAAKAHRLFTTPEIVFQTMDYLSLAAPYPMWYMGSLAAFWLLSEATGQARKTAQVNHVKKAADYVQLSKATFFHYFRNHKKVAEICRQFPDNLLALDGLVDSCYHDLLGKKTISWNNIDLLMHKNLDYCRLMIDEPFIRLFSREDHTRRISKIESHLKKDPNNLLHNQQYLSYLFATGRTDRFFSSWDLAFGYSMQTDKVIPSHDYIKEEMLTDFFSKFSDKAQLSMDYLSFLSEIAGLYALRDVGLEYDSLTRRNKALGLMYRIAKKRDDATRSDLERLGESKNYVAVVKKRAGASDIVFKEGGDLHGEMWLTELMKDSLCDDLFDVPTPIDVFWVDTGVESLEVYAMERVQGNTLEDMLGRGWDLTPQLEVVAKYIGVMHAELRGYAKTDQSATEYFIGLIEENKQILYDDIHNNLAPLIELYQDSYTSMKLDPHIGNFIYNGNKIIKLDNEVGQMRPVQDDFALFMSFLEAKGERVRNLLESNLYMLLRDVYHDSLKEKKGFVVDYFDLEYLNANVRLAMTLYSHYSDRSGESKYLYNLVLERAKNSILEIKHNFTEYHNKFEEDYDALYCCMDGMVLS